jgi:CHAP domain-containing protein
MRNHAVTLIAAALSVGWLVLPTGRRPAALPSRPVLAVATANPGGRFGDHGVIAFGDAAVLDPAVGTLLAAPAVGMSATPDGQGLRIAAADGEVLDLGDARAEGSLAGIGINAPVIAIATTPDGDGYWLAGIDGSIYTFGDAPFLGSMADRPLNSPVVGMAATPTGDGYWEVAADGGVFAFGDARFLGSMGGTHLNSPIVAFLATTSGRGYWEIAADGGVFSFGDAGFFGSLGGVKLPAPILSAAVTPSGHGYWMAGADGSVHPFGDAGMVGSNDDEVPTPTITGFVPTPDGRGYWMLDAATIPTSFSVRGAASGVAGTIVAAARSQLGGNPSSGYYCNPYGPCEEWCALFATWAWEEAGVPIPRYAFTGDIYGWARAHTAVSAPSARPAPGDAVLYGTGPQSAASSVHVGLVAEVWPDGAVVTIEGDAPPGPLGSTNVVINGPYLPSDSSTYNGFGIYAFATP